MTPDFFNGLFEFFGSISIWNNVRAILRDKGYAGVDLYAVAFFFAWGTWNLYYYPHLGQWWSFVGGCSITLANLVWVILMIKFGRFATLKE